MKFSSRMIFEISGIPRKARPSAKHDGTFGQRGRSTRAPKSADDDKLRCRVQDAFGVHLGRD